MRLVSITSTWNNSLWIEYALKWMYYVFDDIIIQETNWTSDDGRWAGDTSPDGTADLIRAFPDPDKKIQFYQLGKWPNGCLAARAELCSHIPECDWVWVCDIDEFHRKPFIEWVKRNLPALDQSGYTSISQKVRSFYWDFEHHTIEDFTRLQKWYQGFNPWVGVPHYVKRDFNVNEKIWNNGVSSTVAGPEIFHYSYVPVPGVEIKGAESFDVPRQRYKDWYKNIYASYDGDNLQDIYDNNGGGVHVFGGLPVIEYTGKHPEVLDNHPLRYARWTKDGYIDSRTNDPIQLKGWWG